jgi:hypothetical protein
MTFTSTPESIRCAAFEAVSNQSSNPPVSNMLTQRLIPLFHIRMEKLWRCIY